MIPGKWKAIENKIGSGGNLITASLIEKYGDFNIIDDLAVKVRIASPLLHKVVTSAHDEYENEKDADDDEDSIENMMRRFVPKNSDCFRWQQFITQLIRRTHLSGVVKSGWSVNSPMKQKQTHEENNERCKVAEVKKEDGNGNVSGSGNGNECKRNGIQPCLPFFNGLIRGLVRSNELPDYIEQMDHSTNKTRQFKLQSPGMTSSDPFLPVLNIGKLRAIASIVSILRFCQCTPYTFATSTDNQTYFQKRAVFATENTQWAMSKAIETGTNRSPIFER